jgi:hypothetical protein
MSFTPNHTESSSKGQGEIMRNWLLVVITTLCVNVYADDDMLEDLSDALPGDESPLAAPAEPPEVPAPVVEAPKEEPLKEEPKEAKKEKDEDPYAAASDMLPDESQTKAADELYAAPTPETKPEPKSETLYRDPRVPKYHYTKPNWGFQLGFSMDSLGKQLLVASQTETAKAIQMEFDYQPAFLQSMGVFGIGPTIAFYPIFATSVAESPFSLWSVGAHVRYQARFFRQQPVVPVVGYSLDYFTYRFVSASNGSMILQGPVFGVWVFLNMFEPSSAAQLYIDYKISRSYFVAEMKIQSGSDANISISGSSLYFGLRFEY